MKLRYTFKDPSFEHVSALLHYAATLNLEALLVERRAPLSDSGRRVVEGLRPHARLVEEASEWPGTKLHGGTAKLWHFELSPGFVQTLAGFPANLFAWLHPDYLEDLCLLRRDGTPYMTSISHEKDLYFDVTKEELSDLKSHIPDLQVQVDEAS